MTTLEEDNKVVHLPIVQLKSKALFKSTVMEEERGEGGGGLEGDSSH